MQFLENRTPARCEVVGEVLFVLSPDGFFSSLRPVLSQLTGLNLESWIRKPFFNFIHPDDVAKVRAALVLAQAGEAEGLQGVRCRAKGELFTELDLSFVPRLRGGKLVEIVCLCCGPIPSPSLLPELTTLANLLETFLANAPIGFCYVDEALRYICVNQPFAAMSGYAPEQLLGRGARELTPKLALLLEPSLRRVLVTGRPELNLELRFPPSAANNEAQSALANFYPVAGSEGKVVGVGAMILDVTERTRTHQLLRESEDRLRLAIDSAALGTWDWDVVENRVIWSDRTRLLHGVSPETEVSWPLLLSCVHPGDREAARSALDRALSYPGEDYRIEYRCIGLQNNVERWLDGRGTVRFNEQGKPERFTGVVADITEQKRAEQVRQRLSLDLMRSNQELARFASIASHDLKEPIRTVASYVSLLENKHKDALDPESLEFMGFVTDATTRMVDLIEDLMKYSKVDAAKRGKEGVDLNVVVEKALLNLSVAIQESGAKIVRNALPQVMGNATQLIQVFQNIVANAIKYQGVGIPPQIHISASRREAEWLFRIQDNGLGFDMKDADKVFDAFVRLHTQSEYSGSGLGLATCRKLIEQHGGRIWAESEIGKGSSFYFTLPASEK